ncbi:MAG TPA: DegT/DnrJ/EryC1/StrS family aminotransferase [Aggregatilineales bacterium]|nr:DegT/DnrJ/EryC1/StrS family aminotransferase [Aggregatilineales bacterium]
MVSTSIPFVDLKAQYKRIKPDVDAAIEEVLSNTAFIGGQKLKDFESAFAAFCDVKHAIGVGNGTDALFIALKSMGIGVGDEVITVSHTFIATGEAITMTGATVRFVDIDPRTYTFDPAKLEAAITDKTKAIIPVHLYGQIADMDAIMQIAEKHHLFVLEDAAQAHGATYKGKKAGSIGHMAAFSFYPGKNLGAYGDAGAIVTNNDEYARFAEMYANHGRLTKYEHEFEGVNSRLDGLQAAVLGIKLLHINQWNKERQQAATWYDELLAPLSQYVVTPYILPGNESVFHLYVIQVPERDRLLERLKENGIAGGVHYPVPLHEQPAYRYLEHKPEDFPVTSKVAAKIVSLPMFPEITQEQCRAVAEVVAAHVKAVTG